MQSTRKLWDVLRDFLVLGVLLVAANLLLDRADFGWFLLNPTPWLVPAALIGARYGFVAGLTSGVLVSALIAAVSSQLTHGQVEEVFRRDAYYYLAIVVVGAVAGELSSLLGLRRSKLAAGSTRIENENLRLRSQLHLVDETRQQLQHQLALYNAPMCALDADLRMLMSHPESEFNDQLLRLLHRCTGVTSAAIYELAGTRLSRSAVLHPTPPLQTTLVLRECLLAEQAVTTGLPASSPDVTSLSTRQPFLAAYSWRDHGGTTSVLLVQDMPVDSFTQQNLARIQIILSWATVMSVLRRSFQRQGGSRRTVSQDDFKIFINEAHQAERIHGLPSALVRLDLQADIYWRTLLPTLPDTVVATALQGQQSIALLLPFSGGSEADAIIREARVKVPTLTARRLLVAGDTTAEELWRQLTGAGLQPGKSS